VSVSPTANVVESGCENCGVGETVFVEDELQSASVARLSRSISVPASRTVIVDFISVPVAVQAVLKRRMNRDVAWSPPVASTSLFYSCRCPHEADNCQFRNILFELLWARKRIWSQFGTYITGRRHALEHVVHHVDDVCARHRTRTVHIT
jgi:hypothetical protein